MKIWKSRPRCSRASPRACPQSIETRKVRVLTKLVKTCRIERGYTEPLEFESVCTAIDTMAAVLNKSITII